MIVVSIIYFKVS